MILPRSANISPLRSTPGRGRIIVKKEPWEVMPMTEAERKNRIAALRAELKEL